MLRRAVALAALAVLFALAGLTAQQGPADGPPVIDIVARDFAFDAPDSIPSGWVTFRMENVSDQEEHLFLLYRLPDNKTFADFRSQAYEPFVDVWNRYDAGELTRKEAAGALGEAMPAWYFEKAEVSGGAGLTEAGRTARVTLHLEPGTYAMDCYVKTPQGTFHHQQGMMRELTVTEDSTGAAPPEADAELTLSNYEISTSGELMAGTRTVAVHAADTPEGFLHHDIHLFRLDGEATTEEIVAWMDWMDLEEFRAPAPGTSLGGVDDLPAGATGYLTVDLEPGRYGWVSQGFGDRGMVETFTVE